MCKECEDTEFLELKAECVTAHLSIAVQTGRGRGQGGLWPHFTEGLRDRDRAVEAELAAAGGDNSDVCCLQSQQRGLSQDVGLRRQTADKPASTLSVS